MDHTKQLGTDPILKLVIRFSLPSIISMLVNAIYNIVDRIFVSNFIGEDALGGLTLVFPIMMISFAIGGLTGVGGSTLISIKFGEKDLDQANRVFGNLTMLSVISGLFIATLGELFLPQILTLVGATSSNFPYAYDYMQIILIGLIFQLSSFAMAALARSEGRPRLSMMTQIISAVTNIVLDALFICGFGWGVKGAAIATVIGQAVGFLILFYYFFLSGKSLLKFHAAYLKLKLSIVKKIFATGTPVFIINLGQGMYATIMIASLALYGEEPAIVSMGAINSLITLVIMPILGLLQGMVPIIGYNHGMRQSERARKALWTSIGIGAIFAMSTFIIMEAAPRFLSSLFLDPSSPTMDVCETGLRLQATFVPFLPINILITSYFQATAQSARGTALSLTRQALIVIAVIVLPLFFKLTGSWLATTAGEALAAVLIIGMYVFDVRRNKDNACIETPLS